MNHVPTELSGGFDVTGVIVDEASRGDNTSAMAQISGSDKEWLNITGPSADK